MSSSSDFICDNCGYKNAVIRAGWRFGVESKGVSNALDYIYCLSPCELCCECGDMYLRGCTYCSVCFEKVNKEGVDENCEGPNIDEQGKENKTASSVYDCDCGVKLKGNISKHLRTKKHKKRMSEIKKITCEG